MLHDISGTRAIGWSALAEYATADTSWEVSENMSNKRPRTNDKRLSYSLLFGEGINSHLKK